MKIIKETWSINQIIEASDAIDPRPQYQRSLVWNLERKQLLMDSILRGYDIPKIYLKGTQIGEGSYKYEVADGQQRINAITDFYNNQYTLPKKCKIGNINVGEFLYSQLPEDLKQVFNEYEIHVSYISKCEQWELNDLFTRLQKGISLLPVELRHAMISEMKDAVQKLLKHKFFENSKILDKRFKRQDYLDHAVAMCYYKGKTDLKAPTLYSLYSELAEDKETVKTIQLDFQKVLDILHEINTIYPGLFKNKWGFVDTSAVIYKNLKRINKAPIDEIAKVLNDFEVERKQYVSSAENLLKKNTKSIFGRDMYDYINAFNREGAFKHSVEDRYRVMEKILLAH